MERQSIQNRLTAGVGLLLFGFLTACGGGSGSSSSLGSGQDPDPVAVDFPIAYVKRPLIVDDEGNLATTDVRDAVEFRPGAELFLRDRASPSAAEQSLTLGIFPDDEDGNPPMYDVKDVAGAFDGERLAFAMRAPRDPDLDDDEQPTWNIWVFDRTEGTLARAIGSDITAEDGQDIAPQFLPDGRVVFSSTRQRQSKAVLLDEGKPQFSGLDENRNEPAFTLHVMDFDGDNLKQITFNQSGDLDPTVTSNGKVVFSRWDNVTNIDRISLYRANPDGTELEALYGVHSHDTGLNGETVEFVETQEIPDGRLLTLLRPAGTQIRMGALPVAIDVDNYTEHDQPTFPNAGLTADAQEVLIPGDLTLDETRPALQGRYASIAPLFDGTDRLLVAWSQCLLRDTTSDPDDPIIQPCTDEYLDDPIYVEANPLYGVWMHDFVEDTQQPIVVPETGQAYSEVIVLEPRVAPPVILDKTSGVDLDPDLVAESVGVLHIRSVYDFDGTATVDIAALSDPAVTIAANRPARFVRIVKAVSIPDDDIVDLDGTDFGRSQAQGMREVLGYAPVEPDGSVKVKVPANVAFWVEILDAQGRRIGDRHQNWLQLRPGEEKNCVGCHTADSEAPHGREAAQAPSANVGATSDGSPFPNTETGLFADMGETMAEVLARINGTPGLNTGLAYDDVWTDPLVRAKDVSFFYTYADLLTLPPVDPACVTNWNSACRIVLNYESIIHPLWGADRRVFLADGITLDFDNTCTSCHAPADVAGAPIVPAAQLDLTDGVSPEEADHFNSYRELLFNDDEQEVVNGALQDRLIPLLDGNGNPVFETDVDGNMILDVDGNPIPVMVTVNVVPSLVVAGANASDRFFSRFLTSGTHADRLSPAELKMISEWIDIGGQYYNNPFDVPQ